MAWWTEMFAETIRHYPGEIDAGMHACEQLLSVPGLPEEIERWTRRNQTWYARKLALWGTVTTIDIPHREGWSLFNPSIAMGPDGDLRMLVRSSNYRIDNAGRYVIRPGEDGWEDGVIRTENFLCQVGSDLRVIPLGQVHSPENLEDARLFFHGRQWMCSATVVEWESSGTSDIALCDISDGQDAPYGMENMDIISHMHQPEKNWMPVPGYDYTGGLKFMISCAPTVVVGTTGWKGTWSAAPYIARSFRGGSQVIPLDDTVSPKLAVVHESVTMEPYKQIYLHRFVLFDRLDDWTILKVSDPFVFEDWGIEFCAGMTKVGEDLVLSYGVRDAEAHLLRIPQKTVMSLLRDPLPEER